MRTGISAAAGRPGCGSGRLIRRAPYIFHMKQIAPLQFSQWTRRIRAETPCYNVYGNQEKKLHEEIIVGVGSKIEANRQEQDGKAMHEFKHHELESGGSGRKVKNPKQAIAIGLSEARRSGAKIPPSPNQKRSGSKRSGGATKKTAAKRAPAKKTATKRSPAKKTAARKRATKKTASRKRS